MPGPREGAASPLLAGPAFHRFLSPHYDDIALSCGGTVALLSRSAKAPEVKLLFGAEPDPSQPLSPFAARLHREWGLDASRVIAARRREEAAASAILGATFVGLPYRDAIYRGTHYQNDALLFGRVAEQETDLPRRIAGELLATAGDHYETRFYVPLGIGNHVDHQLGFAAGLELVAAGYTVWFYEDLPYALQPRAREDRLHRVEAGWRAAASGFRAARLEPVARVDISAAWEVKLDAILSYATQLPTLFRPDGAAGVRQRIDAALGEYALRAGNGILTEQMWRVSGADVSGDRPKK